MLAAQSNKHLNFTGVAPGAELLVYKVTGKDFSTKPEIVAQAIDRAVKDGANIILGFTEEYFSTQDKRPVIKAASRAVEHGIPIMVGIDSQYDSHGSAKFFHIDAISGTNGVETVCKFETDTNTILLTRGSYTTTTDSTLDKEEFLYNYINRRSYNGTIDLPLYALDTDACEPLQDSVPDLTGYMVLVKGTGCAMHTKNYNLKPKNGADYTLFFDDAYLEKGESTYNQFGAVVTESLASKWMKQLNQGSKVNVQIDAITDAYNTWTVGGPALYGGAVSDSYFGPSQSLEIKPIYGAPSSMGINAKWHAAYEVTGYNGKGNAMVAGAYALIAQAKGIKPTPQNIQTLLANTAKAQLHHDGTNFVPGVLASVAQQGAGIIQVYDAANAKASVTPIFIPFNDTDHALKHATLTLVNNNKIEVTYSIRSVPAKTQFMFYDTSNKTQTDAVVNISLDTNSITVQPGQSASIKVTAPPNINLPYPEKLPIWSGYVTFNGTDGTNLAVPYLGVQGSLYAVHPVQNHPPIYMGGHNFPDNGTFTLNRPKGEIEADGYAIIRPTLGVPIIEAYMQSVDPSNDEPDGKIYGQMNKGPYQGEARYNILNVRINKWNGRLVDGTQIPKGKYRMVIRALRLFGDASKQADWQVTATRAFNIVYANKQ